MVKKEENEEEIGLKESHSRDVTVQGIKLNFPCLFSSKLFLSGSSCAGQVFSSKRKKKTKIGK
jgi:hypothetical protein